MKPIAVLISDIHFNIKTLERAKTSLNLALAKAYELEVPCIVAGDLHDTKANLRGECIKAIMECFAPYTGRPLPNYVKVGNHDLINEKSKEHSLSFLQPIVCVIEQATNRANAFGFCMMPYYHDKDQFKADLDKLPKNVPLIMHQGVHGSASGEYFQDSTAVPAEWLAGRRVISGHYHTRQQFALPDGGLMDYIGNPYTLGYGEANDPPKGFQVLYSDGSLEFIPIDLPAHKVVTYNLTTDEITYSGTTRVSQTDIVKIVVQGPSDRLAVTTKQDIKGYLCWPDMNFTLEFEPTTVETNKEEVKTSLTGGALFDSVIDASDADADRKERLKKLWRAM